MTLPHSAESAYERNIAELSKFERFGIKLGLTQTEELFELCGVPLSSRYLHVAGTNGKGSVCAMLDAALRGCGFRTGFYSSPHLVDLRERFRVNGRAVRAERFNDAYDVVRSAAESMRERGRSPTYFEFLTALAGVVFQRAEVDFIVWETGMGGRLDATSVVDPDVAVITGVALDHQQYLGDTVEKIALEKAGIIRPDRPVFIGDMRHDAAEVVLRRAAAVNAPVFRPDDSTLESVSYGRDGRGLCQCFMHRGRKIRLSLAGDMQRRNFRLVYSVLREMSSRYGFPLDRALDSLASVRWPGRCQELDDGLVLDGGHNPDALRALADALREVYPGELFTFVFAGFKDKDVKTNLRILAPLAAEFLFTPLQNERPSYSGEELAAFLPHGSSVARRSVSDAVTAVRLARESGRRTVAAGSLYLVGEILRATSPAAAFDLI